MMMSTPEEFAAHFETLIDVRWYVVVNDTIGGWAIANVPKPTSEMDSRIGEREIAYFVSEEHAVHIAVLHNERRGRRRCRYHFICPNNRLLMWMSRRHGGYRFDAFTLYGLPFDSRCDLARSDQGTGE